MQLLANRLARNMIVHDTYFTITGAIMEPGIVSEASRMMLYSSLYTRGADLSIWGVVTDSLGEETTIVEAQRKIPIMQSLASELDTLGLLLGAKEASTDLQIRTYPTGQVGHPRHQDMQIDSTTDDDSRTTWFSTSIPLVSPAPLPQFFMHTEDRDIVQSKLGSIAIFGPTLEHTTPRQRVPGEVIWITALTTLECSRGVDRDAE